MQQPRTLPLAKPAERARAVCLADFFAFFAIGRCFAGFLAADFLAAPFLAAPFFLAAFAPRAVRLDAFFTRSPRSRYQQRKVAQANINASLGELQRECDRMLP